MPDFNPPLGTTTQIHVPSETSESTLVDLSFFLTFAENEDTSGTWEIWTDLPQLADDASVMKEGEWRAINFQPIQVEEQEDISIDSSAILLQATTEEIQSSTETTYILPILIPKTIDRTYAYTYRHVLESGEVHWLGGEGSNGVIVVQEGEDQAADGGQREGDGWQGIGLEMTEIDG